MTTSSDPVDLGTHDGLTVVSASLKIKVPGSVIAASMGIEPQRITQGTEVVVVLRGHIGSVAYPPRKKTPNLLDREHTFLVTDLMIRDADYARDDLDGHAEQVEIMQAAKEAARKQLSFGDLDQDDLFGDVAAAEADDAEADEAYGSTVQGANLRVIN